jgi:hypothetical protein
MSNHLETQLLAIEQALEEHRREGGLSEGSYTRVSFFLWLHGLDRTQR